MATPPGVASRARGAFAARGLCAALCAALATCATLAPRARGVTSASIAPSLIHARSGAAGGALNLTIHYTDSESESGVPSPVRRSILRFPAGMGIEIPELRSCAVARLRTRGPSGCPPQSRIGGGRALAEVHAGSQTIAEHIALWVFLGPLRNLSPTFLILGRGYTPFDERVVLSGAVLPDSPPYGEDLSISIPPIPTLPLEPDASIVTLSLSVGSTARRPSSHAATVVVPRRCPLGGFPFAASFTYADGSSGSAFATVPCPR